MCDDIKSFLSEMENKNVKCSKIHKEPWGLLIDITLPGSGD